MKAAVTPPLPEQTLGGSFRNLIANAFDAKRSGTKMPLRDAWTSKAATPQQGAMAQPQKGLIG